MLRPLSGRPIDRRDAYRMVVHIAKVAGIPRHISPHSLRHAAITNALEPEDRCACGQVLARQADARSTEPYDRARGKPRPPRRPLPHRIRRRCLDLKAPENAVDGNALTWRCADRRPASRLQLGGSSHGHCQHARAGRQLLEAVGGVRAASGAGAPCAGTAGACGVRRAARSSPMTAPMSHRAKATDAMPPLQKPDRHTAAIA